MKNLLRFYVIGFILWNHVLIAQSVVPQGINYQAIARNSVGNVYINQSVAVKISILSGNGGPVAYSERHTTTTNIFGLFTIKIGSGTPISGLFSGINWATANQYLKVEFDPNGGTSYTDLGAQELLSVPYAFYAASSGSGGTEGPAGPQGPQGEQGPAGPQGTQGPQGPAGPGGGLNCWDTDGDGNQDANEDINNDGLWNALDCRGADGADGPQGPVGAIGQQGPVGLTGPAGPQGAQGPQGPAGPGGGLNCWDTDGDGNQDANEDVNNDGLWNALDCRGADGEQGPIGATGPQGTTGLTGAAGPAGAQGPAGVAGPAGAQGVAGPAGAQGPQGAQGAAGAQGPQGPAGANGQTILNGTSNPGSGIGSLGDFYLNTATSTLFGPKTAGGWGSGVSLIGATGPAGPQGATGPQGPAGTGGGTLDAAYDFGGAGLGRTITADAGSVTINANGTGTPGIGLTINQSGSATSALGALNSGTGNAINASNSNANNSFATIQATTNSATLNNSAVFGQSTGQARAVTGEIGANATSDVAVRGNNLRTNGGIGVEGEGYNGVSGLTIRNDGFAIFGENTGVPNVATGTNNAVGVGGVGGIGVLGQTTNGQLAGVLGQNLNAGVVYNNIGVYGQSETGVGVWGDNIDGSYFAVFSNGDLGAAGAKPFMIDHPADPENKFLKHFSIESDEILNYYRGTAVLDGEGKCIVSLPDYFHLINIDFTYQLTSIGAPSPNLYVSKEVENGKFEIAGGQPNQKVSWTLVAQRNDPYVRYYPENTKTEIEKRDGEKGRYLRPELYGKPMDQRIGLPSNGKVGIQK